jgi:hypothetical protein
VPCHHRLDQVKALSTRGAFQLGKSRARDIISEFLGDRQLEKRARFFARGVFDRMESRHFALTTRDMNYNGQPTAYDVYGVGFSKSELLVLGFPDDIPISLNWVVKAAIVENGELLDVVSLHPPELPLQREDRTFLPPRVTG